MSTRTTVRLADPFGEPLVEIPEYTKLDYVLNCTPGGIGALELTLPTSFDTNLLRRDGRLGVWRSVAGRPPALDNGAIYLLSAIETTSAETKITAHHATSLLKRRIVAYWADSSYSSKVGPADDLIKAFARENLGSSIVGADRDGNDFMADVSAYLSIQGDLGQGVIMSKAAARRNLHEVATELAEESIGWGTYLTFEVFAPTERTLQLRTYTGQRGVDRRAGTADPVILGEARGNLEQVRVTRDYTDEATFVIAGGAGEQQQRLIQTAASFDRMAISPFGRIERFADFSNVTSTPGLRDDAEGVLWNARPRLTFQGKYIQTPDTIRGLDFDLGDMLTAEDPRTGIQFAVRVDIIRESITREKQTTELILRSVT